MPAWARRLSIPASALQSSVLRLPLLLRRHHPLNRGHLQSLASIIIRNTVPGRRATKQARWSIRFRCRVPLSQQRRARSAARSTFQYLRLALELCNELQTAGGSDDLEAPVRLQRHPVLVPEYLLHAGRTRKLLLLASASRIKAVTESLGHDTSEQQQVCECPHEAVTGFNFQTSIRLSRGIWGP